MYSSFVIVGCGGIRSVGVRTTHGIRIPQFAPNIILKPTTRNLRIWASRSGRWTSKATDRTRMKPFENAIAVADGGTLHTNKLWKPAMFTVAFSTASFAGAAIWHYENLRARTLAALKHSFRWTQGYVYKQGRWRMEINSWWSSLSDGQRVFVPICFLNCLVFFAWRVPALQGTMVKYFCSNPASRALCLPMVLSTFSHYSGFHLFANMYVLHSFSTGAVASLGKEQFLGLYLSGGVISSMASYLHKAVTMQPGLSLGASGAIMTVLGYVCTQFPDTRLSILFLPFLSFTAGSAIKGLLAMDTAGVLLGWRFFDHAAHLGGALFGITWCLWGTTHIWQKREPLTQWWHKMRAPPVK